MHDDLIGTTIPLPDGKHLVVTGTNDPVPSYVDVDIRNENGETVGRSVRPAAHVRIYVRSTR